MKYEYRITGLDCAGCAANLARLMKRIPGVKEADIDFLHGKLFVEADEMTEEIYGKMEILADGFDHSVLSDWTEEIEATAETAAEETCEKCGHHHHHHHHEKNEKAEILRTVCFLCLSAALLAAAYFIPAQKWVTLTLYILAYLAAGWSVLYHAVRNLFRGRVFDENFLMTVATAGAFALGEYPEGVFVMLFYTVGEIFQKLAASRSRKSITEMLKGKETVCHVLRGGEELDLPAEGVTVGETVTVRAGERIALDGVIVKGETLLNTAALTGESKLTEAGEGTPVYGGFINQSGVISVKVQKTYENGTLGRILHAVEESTAKKAKSERFITRFAVWYTPVVVAFALIVGVVVPLVFGGWDTWLKKALTFLVVSCPCALVLSVPLGFFVGIGGLAKKGVLVKGGNFVEALAGADILLTDKTGTLTDGKLCVFAVCPAPGVTEEELLAAAAALEKNSNHPAARAVASTSRNVRQADFSEEVAGYGMAGEIDGVRYLAGGFRMMEKFNIPMERPKETGTYICVAKENQPFGVIVLRDSVRKGVKESVAELKKTGVRRVCMLTGDGADLAAQVREETGLDECYSGLFPEEKVEILEKERTEKGVLYIGDGLNDAPVLAAASAGVAMGGMGSDIAVETADVVIMDDDFRKLPFARRQAKKILRIVRENVIFSLAVKFAVMVLSVFGLAPMALAIFADVGVMILAVLNAVRARRSVKF